MSKIIEIKNMSFNYNSKVVYHDFSLEIESGTFTTIIGENGSGKSTLDMVYLTLNHMLKLIICSLILKILNK